MNLKDTFSLAYRTVRSNRLRTGITVAIIAFGIMALIGIITAIEAMNQSLKANFATMGANSFSVAYKERFRFNNNSNTVSAKKRGRRQKKSNLDKPIRLEEAEMFKQSYHFPALVSISLSYQGGSEIRYKDKKTNPNVSLRGGDENYLQVTGFSIETGRNFSTTDVQTGRNVCLLGSDVANKLFGNKANKAVDKIITVGSLPYRVIGVLKSKGSSALMRADNTVITTYNNIRKLSNAGSSYVINIAASDVSQVPLAIDEATGLFRAVRKLPPMEDDNFVIEKSDKLAETFIGLLGSIQGAAGAIGMITLIGAAIGLMNIMLVAVNERTREIGLIKAIGGKKSSIRRQFLFESTIISVLGAVFGIVLGVLVGNLFSIFLSTGFVVPWGWVIAGIVICSVVGLLAGIYPAYKAAKLDPIVALRYE